ncbi:MAG TPA: DUF4126 domain-containing protein, partial [Gemmataceae bacterium]
VTMPFGLFSTFGLATAAGLNAYVPLLIVGLLARYTDLVTLNPPYDLLRHPAVLIGIAILAVLDFVADKIPGLDHALHVAGLVIHPTAGILLALAADSSAGGVHPVLAAICGLVLAGGTHGARAAVRPAATVTTGGLMNPVVSFVEDAVSGTLAVLAILLPVLAFALVLLVVVWTVRRLVRFFRRDKTSVLAR